MQLLVVNPELDRAISTDDYARYNNLSLLNGLSYVASLYGFAQGAHHRNVAIAAFNKDSIPKQRLFLSSGLAYPPYFLFFTENIESEQTSMQPALTLGLRYLINNRNYCFVEGIGFQKIDYSDGSNSFNINSNSYNIGFGSYFLRDAKINGFAEIGIGMTYSSGNFNVLNLLSGDTNSQEFSGSLGLGISSNFNKNWSFDASAHVGYFLPAFQFSINRKLL